MKIRKSPVVGIAMSDIHLSLKPPIARAEEPNWLEAQRRVLRQVSRLAEEHKAPVLISGDIFDRWNAPAELINFAIEHLPNAYSIPGNHDLPSHRPELAHRSAYGTLVRSGRLIEVPPEGIGVGYLKVYGRPLNGKTPRPSGDDLCTHVLLTHEYLWVSGCGYPGASRETRLGERAKKLSRFDVCFVGDNHIAFQRELKNGTKVINCGGLQRRKTSEVGYRPSVWLLHLNGAVTRHYLNTKKDRLTLNVSPEEEAREEEEGALDFVEALCELDNDSLDFRDSIVREMKRKKVSRETRDVVLEAMEEKHGE